MLNGDAHHILRAWNVVDAPEQHLQLRGRCHPEQAGFDRPAEMPCGSRKIAWEATLITVLPSTAAILLHVIGRICKEVRRPRSILVTSGPIGTGLRSTRICMT